MSNGQSRTSSGALPRLAIVVPCCNEEEAVGATAATLLRLLVGLQGENLVADDSYLCLVDDGSTDRTWPLICELHASDGRVHGIKLTRNFGHQGALLAGMLECNADAIITIDADLQDDVASIAPMLQRYLAGRDIVLGVRDDRSSDSFLKRTTSQGYYRFLRLLGIDVVINHADYRLLSRRALMELQRYSETNLFLRGIIPMLGLPTATVRYARRPRTAGISKYPPRRMISLAWEGITSFSVAPVRLVAALGFFIAMGSLAVTVWALLVKLATDSAIPGWASTVVPMYFLGGIQILCLGVIGEYVGKIYLESKRRPRYSVEKRLGGID
ncbi:MAG: glycosyltransferase family 2 protein [Pseudomonadota bacterium]|nr:glycosyltransferase family 2 protein [Pseudomonadota bacterium]